MAKKGLFWKAKEQIILSEGHPCTLTEPPAVFLQSKQVCGCCSQHGTALHPAAPGQTRALCEDPVCRLQLCF